MISKFGNGATVRSAQAEIHWMQHKPCLMSPDLRIFEWKDIQPEKIPRVLETHGPVCWNCFVAETRTW